MTNTMTNFPQELNTVAKAQIESVLRAATLAAESAEKIAAVQFKAAKSSFDDSVKQMKAFAAVKEAAELQALGAKFMQPDMEKANAYAKELYESVAASSSEFAKLFEDQVASVNKQAIVAVDAMLKNAPAGSEPMVAAFKQMMGMAHQAYDGFMQSVHTIGSTVEANIAAAAPAPTSRKK